MGVVRKLVAEGDEFVSIIENSTKDKIVLTSFC
jgi:hypothetical protein